MKDVYIHDQNIKYPNKDFVHMIINEKVHNYAYDKDFIVSVFNIC